MPAGRAQRVSDEEVLLLVRAANWQGVGALLDPRSRVKLVGIADHLNAK
jgi:hypothetical protein